MRGSNSHTAFKITCVHTRFRLAETHTVEAELYNMTTTQLKNDQQRLGIYPLKLRYKGKEKNTRNAYYMQGHTHHEHGLVLAPCGVHNQLYVAGCEHASVRKVQQDDTRAADQLQVQIGPKQVFNDLQEEDTQYPQQIPTTCSCGKQSPRSFIEDIQQGFHSESVTHIQLDKTLRETAAGVQRESSGPACVVQVPLLL